MSTTNTTTTPSTANKPAKRGFLVPCIKCGEDGAVMVSIADTTRFHCDGCGEDFTANDVKLLMAVWQRVLNWCETAPVLR